MSLKPWLAGVAVLLIAVGCGPAKDKADEKKGDEKKPDLAGKCDCVGDTGGGKTYKGTVEIAEAGEGYTVEWTIGRETHIGVALWENDRLSVSWATEVGGKVLMGVVVYKKEKDGTLKGKWTQYPGTPKVLEETLTPQKK